MNSPRPQQKTSKTEKYSTTEIDVGTGEEPHETIEIDLSAIPAGGPLGKSGGVKSKRPKHQGSWKQDHFSSLEDALMCPDLYGPMRVPRYGNSDRTVLCTKKTRYQFQGETTNTVKGVIALTSYGGNAAIQYYASSETAGFTNVNSNPISAGILFPATSQLTDVSLVALSMTIIYIGKPLDAQGTVLLCTVPDKAGAVDLVSSTYSGLSYLPNAVIVPVSSLLDEPLRVSLLHQSPSSWEFKDVNTPVEDVAVPVVLTSGLAVGTTVQYEITATYEGRSNVTSSNAIPYEATSADKAKDLSMFENVVADMGRMYNQVTEFIPTQFTAAAMRAVRDGTEGFIAKGATGVMHAASNRILQSVLHGGGIEFRRAIRGIA